MSRMLPKFNGVVLGETLGHVVGIKDSYAGGHFKTFSAHHADIRPNTTL